MRSKCLALAVLLICACSSAPAVSSSSSSEATVKTHLQIYSEGANWREPDNAWNANWDQGHQAYKLNVYGYVIKGWIYPYHVHFSDNVVERSNDSNKVTQDLDSGIVWAKAGQALTITASFTDGHNHSVGTEAWKGRAPDKPVIEDLPHLMVTVEAQNGCTAALVAHVDGSYRNYDFAWVWGRFGEDSGVSVYSTFPSGKTIYLNARDLSNPGRPVGHLEIPPIC